jgi:uncharacterized lipoprotein YddW (UPF0748 family)
MLKPGMVWGPSGVQHMLDACKACGWSRIYWRVLDGGRALYHSRLLRPMGKWDADSYWTPQSNADKALFQRFNGNMPESRRLELLAKFDALDYSKFDPLAEAARYGHKIGLEIHAWVTINEDDHGWGLQSEFSKKHPEYRWRGRNGKVYHSQLSFAFPEVRQYKLAILKELLAKYELDGLFLDWIRTGDVRDNPQNDADGVADYGYESPLLKRFKKKTGKDAETVPNNDSEWIQVRTEPQTDFMRDVRKLAKKRKLPVAAMVGHPWHYRGLMDKIAGNLSGLLLDVHTWARERLVDSLVAAGYYRDGGNAELAFNALQKETEGKADIWTYAWVPTSPADAEQSFAVADKVSAKQILFWEADYIDDRANAAELKSLMKSRAVVK